MSARVSWRWPLWLTLLLLSAGLVAFGDRSPGSAVVAPTARVTGNASAAASSETEDVPKASPQAPGIAASGAVLLELLDRKVMYPSNGGGRNFRDLFAPTTWGSHIAEPSVQRLPPPAPLSSPIQSLIVVGKKQEEGRWEVFLTRGQTTLIAREGQTLDGEFRVERIAPPEMQLVHLSTGQPLSLGIGDAR